MINIKQIKLVFIGLTVLFLMSSCLVGPNYHQPRVVSSPSFKEAVQMKTNLIEKSWSPIKPQDDIVRGAWWIVFRDPVLNDLEEELNKYNQNIVQTEANYRQSLALVDEARASLYPTLSSAFSLFRQRQGGGSTSFVSSSGGATSIGTASFGSQSTASTITNYNALLNASWEPDIWGQVRRTIEANRALAESNAALIAVTRLSAQASLAQYYFELRIADKNQRFLNNTMRAYQRILRFAQNQYRAGLVSRADVAQAQSQLESAQATAVNIGIARGQYEHAIAVLTGRPPYYLNLKKSPLIVHIPAIPFSIPSLWLQRRPDIAQAERLLQQYNASIGVAIAAYFPNLNLTSSGTASANSFHRLIHKPALGWSTGLQIAETLFDGGLRKATVRAAREAYNAQVAVYRQVVLNAFQDVEDNLISIKLLQSQSTYQRQAAQHARLALKIITNQYHAGTVNYVSVLNAQVTAFNAELSANNVQSLQLTSAVGLIKALGGAWIYKPPPF